MPLLPICPYSYYLFILENIGPAAAGPAGPVPTPMPMLASSEPPNVRQRDLIKRR